MPRPRAEVSRSVRLEVRCTPEEKDRVRAHAEALGTDVSGLVRDQLGALLTGQRARSAPGGKGQGAAGGADGGEGSGEGPGRSVELATWLSGRTGLPRALAWRAVQQGRVTVGGEVWRSARLPAAFTDRVELDGAAV